MMSPYPVHDYSFSLVSHPGCIIDPLLAYLFTDKISKWGNVSFKNKWLCRLTGIQQMMVLHFTSANLLSIQEYVLAYGFADQISPVTLSSTYLMLFFFFFKSSFLVTTSALWHRYLALGRFHEAETKAWKITWPKKWKLEPWGCRCLDFASWS